MNTNTLQPEYGEVAETFLLAWDAGDYDSIPASVFILEIVERCQELAALRQADQQAQPVAWLKEWTDVSYPDDYDHRRVDLTPDCEAWLQAKNPKITPLFTSPPAQPQAEGMALVPVEPTEEMIDVGNAEALRVSSFAQDYEAMVGAYLASQKENKNG